MLYPATGPLLVIEDNDEDFEIIQWALKKLSIRTPLERGVDGEDAFDYLYKRGEHVDAIRPSLILLDLNLIADDGREILQEIKQDEDLRSIPVIVWTSSSDPKDIEICFRQGANSYMLKPMNIEKLLQSIELLNSYWFGVAMLPDALDE